MNNPILLSLIVYQFAVATYYFIKGGYLLGSLFIIYGIANILLLFIKLQ